MSAAANAPRPFPPVAAGTRIGHVHLKVADLDRASRSTAACSVSR